MPKQTFFNLPAEKREALIEVAIDEFANNDYRSASVSRIASRAGIAKGSIYQYFEDKRDLFMYLLDLAGKEKLAFLQQTPEPGTNFFDYLRWLTAGGARATIAHPRLAQVGYRAYYGDLPFHDEALARLKEMSLRFVGQLVKEAIAKGDIDPEIDPELAVFVVNTLISELGNFIFRRQGLDPQRLGREGHEAVDMDLVEGVFDDFVRVLQYGLANRSQENWRPTAATRRDR